jgi:ubiquitin-conjugating enzyme E2 D
MAYIKRIAINYRELQDNPAPLCFAEPKNPEKNLTHWVGHIQGPGGTPFAGGSFNIALEFPPDYPFKPPTVQFITPIYHPNISEKGEICLDILHSQWSPALSIRSLLISLCSLLADPNGDHGLNREALRVYRSDPKKYEEIARDWTKKFASN